MTSSFCRTNRLLLSNVKYLLAADKNAVVRPFSRRSQRAPSQVARYGAILAVGALSYYVFDRYRSKLNIFAESEPSFNLDLNEIYERAAIVFLSSQELRDVLGMPIKVTSNNSLTDVIRSIDFRKEGSDLYAFIAYDVKGPNNSAIVYCKLKMDKSSEKFKTESILAKFTKPDSSGRSELVIKPNLKSESNK